MELWSSFNYNPKINCFVHIYLKNKKYREGLLKGFFSLVIFFSGLLDRNSQVVEEWFKNQIITLFYRKYRH